MGSAEALQAQRLVGPPEADSGKWTANGLESRICFGQKHSPVCELSEMERPMRLFEGLLGAGAVFLVLTAQIPSAQAQPVWVASNGMDTNSCTRAAPCATFSKAATLTGFSEIRCADAGVFAAGGLTITRSLTINCEDNIGSGLGPGETITVNTAATDVVLLKGVDINGARFGWASGQGGIVFT
jgi:hypothetical protein